MIFDTHCHLNDEQLLCNVDEVIARALNAGVTKFLVVGWNKESSLKAIELAKRYDCIYAAIGFHPTDTYDLNEEEFNSLMKYANDAKVVAIGEIGLDYFWCKEEDKKEIQKKWFIHQIEFANKIGKPIIVHNRNAFEDCLSILKNHIPEFSGVVHCFSGSVESMKEVIDLGLLIGLDGPVTFSNAKTPKDVAYEVPLEKLLLETDSPYLAPHPLRGTVNEPVNIRIILDVIAEIKELSKKHIADVTYSNACKLFGINE